MRSVYVRTPCGCAVPGITKALERDDFEKKVRARVGDGRVPAAVTRVSAYVNRKEGALTRKLAKTLRKTAKVIRDRVATLYAREFPELAKPAEKLASSNNRLRKDAAGDRIEAILEALRTGKVGADLVDDVTPAMLAAFRRASLAGVTEVGLEALPDMTEQLDAAAQAYAERRGGELITDLAGTTEEDMRSLLGRAVEEGMSVDQLKAEVEDMGAFGGARARMIARTELAFAHVQGNVEGWKQSGVVVGKRAILGDLHDVPDICDECVEAGVVGIDDDFLPGYPYPPFHPNCVCDVEPVLGPEE